MGKSQSNSNYHMNSGKSKLRRLHYKIVKICLTDINETFVELRFGTLKIDERCSEIKCYTNVLIFLVCVSLMSD